LILRPKKVHASIKKCFDQDSQAVKELETDLVIDGHYIEGEALKQAAQENNCDHSKLVTEINRVQSVLQWDLNRRNQRSDDSLVVFQYEDGDPRNF